MSKCRQFPDVCCMCEQALPRCYPDLNFVTLSRGPCVNRGMCLSGKYKADNISGSGRLDFILFISALKLL